MKAKAKNIVHQHIVDDLDNEALTAGKVYCVIGVIGDYYRIVNDCNEPALYDKDLFEVVDPSIPPDWIETIFDEESYFEPPETCAPGFYEDFFDGVPYAIKAYNSLLKKLGIQSHQRRGQVGF